MADGHVIKRTDRQPDQTRPGLAVSARRLLRDIETLKRQCAEITRVEADRKLRLRERLLHHANRAEIAYRSAAKVRDPVGRFLICICGYEEVWRGQLGVIFFHTTELESRSRLGNVAFPHVRTGIPQSAGERRFS